MARAALQRSPVEIGPVLDQLYRRHAGRLAATLTRLVGADQPQLIEDVVQEALIRALELWPVQGVPESPTTWLTQVARNRAIDLLRRDRRRSSRALELLAVEPGALEPEGAGRSGGAEVDGVL